MMAGVDFIGLVATSLTFGTTGFSILSVDRTPALLLLISAVDLHTSDALISSRFTADSAALLTVDFTAGFFMEGTLTGTGAFFFAAPVVLDVAGAFFAMADLAADCAVVFATVFAGSFALGLATGLAPIFTAAFTDLAAGLSKLVAFSANFVATLFRVDAPAFPLPFVLAILVGLATVLPGFFAVTVFLADFVTVAFMSSILNELSNTLTSSGAVRDSIALAADKTPAPLA
jgi:hypothetical protein